jgi:hypothetical protein
MYGNVLSSVVDCQIELWHNPNSKGKEENE